MNDPPSVLDLLNRACQGDDDAFAELFARHRDRVRQAVALRLERRIAARVDVSDVVQDTYLEACRRLPAYLQRPAMPFDLWLLWLAREQVLGAHRRHLLADRRAVGLEAPPLPPGGSSLSLAPWCDRGHRPARSPACSASLSG